MESPNQNIEQAYEELGRPDAVDATIRNMFVGNTDMVRLVLTMKTRDDANVRTIELGTAEFYATGLLESMAHSTLKQLFGNDGLALKTVRMPREKEPEADAETDVIPMDADVADVAAA